MKIKLQGKIGEMKKESSGIVTLHIHAHGKVETHLINAKEAALNSILTIKGAVADEVKLGATLTITVSDEEPNERST